MPSADLDAALTSAVKARTVNSGQSCIAAKRFFVAEAVYEEFVRRFVGKMQSLKIGDPFDESTDMGRSRRPRSGTACMIRCVDRWGGERNYSLAENRPKGGETFILRQCWRRFRRKRRLISRRGVRPGCPALSRGECGGGDCAGQRKRFRTWRKRLDERSSRTGTFRDRTRGGNGLHNAMVASDPRLPFGGIKRSGYGRELSKHLN